MTELGVPELSLVVLVGKYHRRDAHGVDTTGVLADVFFQQIFPAHNVANQ